MSESEFSDENSISKIESINDIYQLVYQFLIYHPLSKNINIEAEISEIYHCQTVYILKLADLTGKIKAIIFKNNYNKPLSVGNKVKIYSWPKLYNGEIELIINKYETIGNGNSSQYFELLKEKLSKKGYFDKKIKLKDNYCKIGIISSLNAAGLRDFLHTINSKSTDKIIYIYPTLVQGTSAPNKIFSAIQLANKHNFAEILCLIRGGGSAEDLECFNTEKVADAIHYSKIPIVTGIGHEINISLADLCASHNFITPTAVAQNITKSNLPDYLKYKKNINKFGDKIKLFLSQKYQYIFSRENKLSKFRNKIIEEFEVTNYSMAHIRMGKKIKQELLSFYHYLIDNEIAIQNVINKYIDDITQSIAFFNEKLKNNLENYQKKINEYNLIIKETSKPKIFTLTGKEIISMKDLQTKGNKSEGTELSIKFIDGEINITI